MDRKEMSVGAAENYSVLLELLDTAPKTLRLGTIIDAFPSLPHLSESQVLLTILLSGHAIQDDASGALWNGDWYTNEQAEELAIDLAIAFAEPPPDDPSNN